MNKIKLIIEREYLSRVKKKSFLVLTLLTPILFGLLMFLPSYLMTRENKEEQKVAVIDRSSIFLGNLEDSKSTKFKFFPVNEYETVKQNFQKGEYYALLEIPENILTTNKVLVFSNKQINIDVKNHINWQLEKKLEDIKREELVKRVGIPDLEDQIKKTKTSISVETIKVGEDGKGKKSSTEIAMVLGYVIGFLIYMFVFLYGTMVMRGVLEEKQNRIVEVIISSVKPVELMIGKIIGIAAVGLTQFVIWVVLIFGISLGAKSFFLSDSAVQQMSQAQSQNIMMGSNQAAVELTQNVGNSQFNEIMAQISGINFAGIIICFLVYFILGYLLYSSLMAAIASSVDTEEDVNQLMLPIQIPLIASIIIMMSAIKNPEGPLAVWCSHIPFTSPIIMMVRVPFGVPWWEILVSMSILAITTLVTVWFAAKIYRTGVLMYGKKITWKELIKWMKYRG
ncbi:MAG TPA: ABC transporter permease [Prolixibacteraceae bacterium]|nr:ABC transporter permease [Prolixibacteraceae bacterium]